MNMKLIDAYKAEAEKAKKEWQEAYKQLDYADPDLIDSVILDIKSKQSRYTAFARRIKNEVFRGL